MKVGISSCSDGLNKERINQVEELKVTLASLGVEAVLNPHIYAVKDDFAGTDEERAEDLMNFYRDDTIEAIFDISGGDLANGVLPYLDYDLIAKSGKELWGYSDLTTLINAIYTKTGKSSVLYQIRSLVWVNGDMQKERFKAYLDGNEKPLFDIDYRFLQGDTLRGIVVGGNIRCFLKLAGTKFWPDMKDKVLLLEALGGGSGQIATLLNQLDQMGVFKQVAGVLLGTFTKYEESDFKLTVYDLLRQHISPDLPVAKTDEIGHGSDLKAIRVGEHILLR